MKRLIAACALVLVAPAVHAQSERATLAGVVKDASGAVLQNATVTVTNVATNVTTKVKTTNTGTYLVVNLVSGQYLVEAESSGLQKQSQVVILETGQRGG